jgi:hypothetical protein
VAVGAIVLLVINQGQVSSEFITKLDQGSSTAALLSGYFNVTMGIGCILAIVLLALAALYNLAADLAPLVAAGSRAAPLAAYANVSGVPPAAPPGPDGGPPPAPPWDAPDAPPTAPPPPPPPGG